MIKSSWLSTYHALSKSLELGLWYNCVNYLNQHYLGEPDAQRKMLSQRLSGKHFLGQLKTRLKNKFVDIVPPYDQMEEDELYVCLSCNVAVHKCACGCGQEVVTTIAPRRWKMTYDGKTVTLSPSIGNWYFECQSHYFIRENKVVWTGSAPKKQRKTIKDWLWRFWGRFKRKY